MNTQLYRLMKAKRWNGQLEPGFSKQGRWHSNRRSVIYMTETPSLALAEWMKSKLSVGLLLDEASQAELILIELTLQLTKTDITTAYLKDLPKKWWCIPNIHSIETQDIGNAWLDAKQSLALRVPSATLPPGLIPAVESNVLLNPNHNTFSKLVDAKRCEVHAFNLKHYLG